jgi:hypothetical protein
MSSPDFGPGNSALSFEPRYSSQRSQIQESNGNDFCGRLLEATTGTEDVPDNLLARCPVFAFADTQILRERNRPFSHLVLRLNINQPGPEALYQIICKRGHQPGPDPLDTNSSPAQQHCRLGSPIGIFTLGCAS